MSKLAILGGDPVLRPKQIGPYGGNPWKFQIHSRNITVGSDPTHIQFELCVCDLSRQQRHLSARTGSYSGVMCLQRGSGLEAQ